MSFDITPFSSDLARWETFSSWMLGALLAAAAIETILKFEKISKRFPRVEYWLGWAAAVTLLLGAFGEIISHSNRTILTAKIVATLNASAGAAHERAAELEKTAAELRVEARRADERTAILEKDTEGLKLRAKEAERDTAAANKRGAELSLDLERLKRDSIEQKSIIAPRKISDQAKSRFIRYARGRGQPVSLLLSPLQEPRSFGSVEIRPLLQEAKYKVNIINLEILPKEEGLVVCDNGNGEGRLYNFLRRAGIHARRIAANAKDRPAFCEPDFGLTPTIRVYVGQKLAQSAR